MPLYVLDTDHMTTYFRGGREGENLIARLQNIAPDDYGTTIISYEEQVRGWLDKLAKTEREQSKVFAYEQLDDLRLLYFKFAVWQYDDKADVLYAQLVRQRIRIGAQDLRITSIALATGAVVLTRNRKDFAKVPGLRIEDWTTDAS